ncbi:SGNH/GDSL hydrolase family protein [Membranihabitans marinus]|uniref:SGNH/GDSL hydrolase family protein n=1 Tax=Membranihabitans marinus TaxID=1227546 RepID=UPI001F41C54B|nr:SGNH/GDSL hydrolase family protein [Membranihabitans marinus]
MNYLHLKFIFLLILTQSFFSAQAQESMVYYDAAKTEAIQFQSQGWSHDVLASPYHRMPAEAKGKVRDAVWGLSTRSAGITLTFATDAPMIQVKYQVSGQIAMNHMPATGVSGLDLYVERQGHDQSLWCRGRYDFKDTITYTYKNLQTYEAANGMHHYSLYLPLYNEVKWLEIGIPADAQLISTDILSQKPIVVYGTSIAQGGCASRPGMGWTNILQRKLNTPVVNLAYSGNGRLEAEVVDFIAEIDAAAFVLDCLPNLGSSEKYPDNELKARIRKSVNQLRDKHPNTPILMVQHAGYSDDYVTKGNYSSVFRINNILEEMYDTMQREGVRELYILRKNEINMCMDCTVDGTHQTDLGMEYYGKAYAKKFKTILK